MLYLAEVQKKSGLLAGKTGLKLLAQQRSEDRWQVLANGEVLSSDKVGDFGPGSLVLVDVSDKSGQVQKVKEATRTILNTLQNSSRFQDRLKDQEEEIEQWKQSLTFQTQELHRREQEMESRWEQTHQLEEEMARINQEKQEAVALREEAQHLRLELENRDRELKKAWEQLKAEQQDLESHRQAIGDQSAGGGLDAEQMALMQDRLGRLMEYVPNSEGVQGQLTHAVETLGHQKAILDQHWQQLDQHRTQGEALQAQVTELEQTVQARREAWEQGQGALERAKAEQESSQQLLVTYQDYDAALQRQIQATGDLHGQLTSAMGGLDPIAAQQVDVAGLEGMPLAELRTLVEEQERDYTKTFNFVNDQEDELRLLSQDMETKKAEIEKAAEFDRLTLDNELADLQSEYQLFDESLVPQRKRLREAKAVLSAYRSILAKRQGSPVDAEGGVDIDLTPVLSQLETLRQGSEAARSALGEKIQALQAQIGSQSAQVAALEAQQNQERQALEALAGDLGQRQVTLGELLGKINAYGELLQPTQETLHSLEQQLQSLQQEVDRLQEVSNYQLQLLGEMNQSLATLAA